jgi:nicotinamidase/pyrazinamidase
MGNQPIKIVPCDNKKNVKKFILGIIDVQNDFITGSLSIKDAENIIAPINKLRFMAFDYMSTFISQDYHPDDHMSFNTTHNATVFTKKHLSLKMDDESFIDVEQDMWPPHCIQNTDGSKFHKDLVVTNCDIIIKKGTNKNVESYSAFGDEFKGKYEKTILESYLKNQDITDIILTGLATDFCVYYTALDARRLGYDVHVIVSCIRGVLEDSTKKAINDMESKGVLFYDSVDEFCESSCKYII